MAALKIRRDQLLDLLDLEYLEEVQYKISNILGIASVVVDLDGIPITKPTGFTNLCRLIRSTKKGERYCTISDKNLGEEAAKKGGYVIRKCDSLGLLDAACPIYIDGIHIANFLIGQIVQDEIPKEQIMEFAHEVGLDPDELIGAYNALPKMDLDLLNKAAQLLEVFSNEVSNLAAKNLRLNEQIQKYERYNEQIKRSFKNQILLNNVFLKFFENEDIHDTIYHVFYDMAGHFRLNRAVVYEYNKKLNKYIKIVEYKKQKKDEDFAAEIESAPVEKLFLKYKDAYFPKDSDFYSVVGKNTGIITPVFINSQKQAFIYLDDGKEDKKWQDDEVKLILNIAYLIGTLLSKNKSEKEVINSLMTLEKIIGNTDAVIYVNDIETHELLFTNSKDGSSAGKISHDYIGHKCFDVYKGINNPCENCKMQVLINNMKEGKETSITYDVYDEKQDKWYTVTDSIINWIDERPVHMHYAIDITEKKNYEKQIRKMAYTDSLLGVPNRLACQEDLDRFIRDAMENNKLGAVMFLDLDNFKTINDTYGHSFADRILLHIVEFFNTISTIKDTFYRLGGDEFVIVLHDTTKEEVDKVAKLLLERFNKPWQHKGRIVMSTASIGIAFYPTDADTYNNILKCSDKAMYKAKDQGRNKAVYFQPEFL